ncbi:hypothetical protein ACOME3_008323 [Neoechinorhynchus agilis]
MAILETVRRSKRPCSNMRFSIIRISVMTGITTPLSKIINAIPLVIDTTGLPGNGFLKTMKRPRAIPLLECVIKSKIYAIIMISLTLILIIAMLSASCFLNTEFKKRRDERINRLKNLDYGYGKNLYNPLYKGSELGFLDWSFNE